MLLVLLLVVLAIVLTAFFQKSRLKQYDETFFAMDTIISIRFSASDRAPMEECRSLVEELENLFSRTDHDSEISRLNREGTARITELSEDTVKLIRQSFDISRNTGGAFDCTLGQFTQLWDFTAQTPQIPAPQSLTEAKKHTGYENLQINENQMTLLSGVQLDLGGIAKGYAADKVKQLLCDQGIQDGLISLGGNVYAMGTNASKPWKIGISDPENTQDTIGYVLLSECSAVTSGDYQRYFELDGKKYHHILDPDTGIPVENELSSVTVLDGNSAKADGYSTALFVMGLEKGMQFAEDHELSAVFVTKDNRIYTVGKTAQTFTLTSDRYEYQPQN